jgi:chemotaxis protein MotB
MQPVSSHPVFVVDDTFFRSRTPKSTHWSVAWSDLMMTMFILFLTLFVYQLAHREFLSEESPEIIAGTTMPIAGETGSSAGLPFQPIKPIVSHQETILLKKGAEKPEDVISPLDDEEIDAVFEKNTTPSSTPEPEIKPPQPVQTQSPDTTATTDTQAQSTTSELPTGQQKQQPEETAQPDIQHKAAAAGDKKPETIITRMYDLSRVTVAEEKLEKFASVELVPDKTMRIILTGDLLFPSGTAALTDKAKQSLKKLIPIIRQSPYMINVIGHTDNIPMHSQKFASNWELSTARASRVARFLIEEANIPASHFVVAGYSYFRPIKPNTTAANRGANRRVEIIISKEPPPARQPQSTATP